MKIELSDLTELLTETAETLIFPFGKHAGTRVSDIPVPYVRWVIEAYDTKFFEMGWVREWIDDNIDILRDIVEGGQVRAVKADTFTYDLSPSQANASNGIVDALASGTQFMRLEGGAGYGKSFAVRDIVKRAILAGWQIKATAVSYVATQVLSGQLDSYTIPCTTLARAIGLDKEYDGPREIYVMGDRSRGALAALFNRPKTLLVIDEYSMINDEYAKAIGAAATQYEGAVLVVGDLMQLPPVNQTTDCIFSSIEPSYTLTDPKRFSKDSDLYKVEQTVRNEPDKAVDNIHTIAKGSDEVMVYATGDDLLEVFKRTCKEFPHEDNRILYYRRADVIKANNAVRKALFGDNPAPLEAGERLLVVRTSDCAGTRYYTGTTLDVIGVALSSTDKNLIGDESMFEDGPPEFKLYATLGETNKTIPILFAVSEHKADPKMPGGEEFNDTLKELAEEANQNEDAGMKRSDAWAPYREYKDSFVFCAYNYATTVHKAQGATVDRVFVSPRGLFCVPQVGDKLAYVALTRARKEIHIS